MDNEFDARKEHLRKQAEALLIDTSRPVEDLTPAEVRALIHGYQVHQIELELQNEELRKAQSALEESRARYFDLYDLAPVGYLTLSEQGLILEANLTASTLLGGARGMLVSQPIYRFILKEDQDIYYLHRRMLFETGDPQECELRLVKSDGAPFWALLKETTTQAENGKPLYRVVISDIALRKQAEKALIESEAIFKGMFNEHSAVMLLIDPKTGQIVKANQAAAQYYRYVLENLIQMKIQQLNVLSPEEIAKKMDSAFNNNVNIFEFRHLLADGQVRDVQVHSTPIQFQNQILLFSIIFDITERKRAEEALRMSLTRYDELVANVPVGVYVFWTRANGHLEFEYVSNRWCEIHQLKREDVLADVTRANSQVHPDERDAFLIRNQESFRDQVPFTWEGRCFVGDGKLRWIRLESIPIVFDNGDIRWFGFSEDITKRKQAELALSKIQKIMAQAEELAGLGSWEWNINNDTWLLSDNWKKIHGVPDIQLTTPQLLPIAHPEDRPAIEEAFVKAKKNGEPYDIEHRIIRQNTGEVRYVYSRGLVEIDDNGKPGTMIGAVQDITERKKAENIIRQVNQELRKSNFEKDKLISIIAHDLRSPMAGILASTEIMAKELGSFSEQDLRFLATVLHNNARNTIELLEDLLQWARMSQDGIDYAPEVCSLNELVGRVLSTAQDVSKSKGIVIRSNVQSGLNVLVDQPMLKTVIRNVLFNAIKFTHRGGEIVIKARQEGKTVSVAIQDTGIGMKEPVLATLFTLDKEKRQLGTEGEKGTGMGLVLCKQFIEQHGGEIWAESELGKGTTVFFTLPGA